MDVRGKQSSGKRLIDADKLLTNAVTISNSEGQATWSAVSTIDILAAPIVDAVEVVRCRECKYHKEEGIEMVYCPNMIGGWVENEWFCANGKQKGGAD